MNLNAPPTPNYVCQLTKSREADLYELRKKSFASAPWLKIKEPSFKWSRWDENGHVFAISINKVLVSSLRYNIIDDTDSFFHLLGISEFKHDPQLPTQITGKAVTHPNHQHKYYNDLLRLISLKRCVSNAINWSYCTLAKPSAQFRHLQMLGYEMVQIPSSWTSATYETDEPTYMARIHLSSIVKYAIPALLKSTEQVRKDLDIYIDDIKDSLNTAD